MPSAALVKRVTHLSNEHFARMLTASEDDRADIVPMTYTQQLPDTWPRRVPCDEICVDQKLRTSIRAWKPEVAVFVVTRFDRLRKRKSGCSHCRLCKADHEVIYIGSMFRHM